MTGLEPLAPVWATIEGRGILLGRVNTVLAGYCAQSESAIERQPARGSRTSVWLSSVRDPAARKRWATPVTVNNYRPPVLVPHESDVVFRLEACGCHRCNRSRPESAACQNVCGTQLAGTG